MIPNFFIAGCQKCATTTLHHALTQHPEIYLPQKKESKFFVVDEWYARGIDYYASKFDLMKNEKAAGEVDPDYIYFEKALKRITIHFDLEKLKFIFIFRNPVERAFSHYLMTYRRGIETKSFAEAIACEQERIKTDFDSKMHFSYVDRGFYYKQLIPFREVLQPKQMLFLLTEDLKQDRNTALKKCFEFLDVDSDLTGRITSTNHHRASIPRSDFLLNEIVRKKDSLPKIFFRILIPNQDMRHKLRKSILKANQTSNLQKVSLQKKERLQLIETYRDENQKFAELIHRDLDHWSQEN